MNIKRATSQFAIWENSRWIIVGDCKTVIEKLKQLGFKASGTVLYRMKRGEERKFCMSYQDPNAEFKKIKRLP